MLTLPQVWSFSPPEDVLYERPLALQQRSMEASNRPQSAHYRQSTTLLPGLRHREGADLDVDMADACPSTAPLQQGNTTFFHDD
jgi:F-box and WD-40 domain protein CDC4